ncbi:MAG: DEAD/DEAH box helicase family protein, partial [Clostridia bacterium]|nr:DEAD/DEAH box helicase family protein [Clostridia bacterium]
MLKCLSDVIEVRSCGEVFPKKSTNPRTPYSHQKDAMQCLDSINQEPSFGTLIVLPTGGGKTYTASSWLLKNAIDRKKKVLWLAHRQMLLDQAAKSFQQFAHAEILPHVSSFRYRIIS